MLKPAGLSYFCGLQRTRAAQRPVPSMPKMKSNSGAKKRFKVTSGGKVMRQHSMKSHILTKKTTKRKRRLRQAAEVTGKIGKRVKQLLNS